MHDLDPDPPMCRATIRDGAVTLNRWRPGMGPRGPLKAGYAQLTAALADLTRPQDDELIVVPVRGAPWGAAAADVLVAWAGRVGYRRIWLPDRVADLAELAESGWAAVTCPACGAYWEDGGAAFWTDVRRDGWFPPNCLACGGSLPEWEPVPDPATVLDDPRTMEPHA